MSNLLTSPQQSKNQMLSQVPVTTPAQSPQPDRRRDLHLQHRESDRRRASKVGIHYLTDIRGCNQKKIFTVTAITYSNRQQYPGTNYTAFCRGTG